MTKDIERQREMTRKRVQRYRERHRKQSIAPGSDTSKVIPQKGLRPVTDADIEALPMSLKAQLQAETNARRVFKMHDNLREREENMVRRFRGW